MATRNQVDVALSGSSGTGTFVGANTPTLITPVIGAATGTSLVTTSTIQTTAGGFSSGSTGNQGFMILIPTTATTGRFITQATPNSGNFDVRLTNAAFGQGTTISLPDPGSSTATVQYVGASLGAASATSVTFSSTSGIIGTTTNDSAAAGSVGEIISSVIASGSAVSLTNSTPA